VQKVDKKQLSEKGYCLLRGILPLELIEAFETEVATFAKRQFELRGIAPVEGEEPLVTLFKIGGRYRHMLYNMMQNLTALTNIKAHLFNEYRPGGALEPLGFELPISTAGLRIDLPKEGTFDEPWHQDYSSSCLRSFHAWVPMRRVDAHFGSVRVVPGTHKGGFVPHDLTNPRHPVLPPSVYEGKESIVVEAEPGDVLVFNSLMYHRSAANHSDRIKFIIGYMMQDLASMQDPEDENSPMWEMFEMTRRRIALNQQT
jgi:hypothetical protein